MDNERKRESATCAYLHDYKNKQPHARFYSFDFKRFWKASN